MGTEPGSGLARTGSELAPSLTARERRIVEANRSPFCHQLLKQRDPELGFILIRALKNLPAVSGYTQADKADAATNEEITLPMIEVVKRYNWLKVYELELILNEGMIGEYGEFYSLNARTLNSWIKRYYEQERGAALKKQLTFELAQREEAEKARQQSLQLEAAQAIRAKLISDYSKLENEYRGQQITYRQIPAEIDTGNIWYNKFWRAGIHRIDRETFERYTEEATPTAREDLKELRSFFQMEKGAFASRAKSLARSRIFREKLAELLNAGTDLEKLLKDHNL